MTGRYQFESPADALAALLGQVQPVGIEVLAWSDAVGRVLAEPLIADRDSPPCDVSAMDGYAVRLNDLAAASLRVAGAVAIGSPPPDLPAARALRIVTGAAVPRGADAVVPREDVREMPDQIVVRWQGVLPGQHIRRRGENLPAGQPALCKGSVIHAPAAAAMASFGASRVSVHRKVRAGVLVTGDELLPIEATPQPWQIRDANGPALHALLAACPRVAIENRAHVPDNAARLQAQLARVLDDCDLVLLTGGVSMGNRDYVPWAVQDAGARIVFHKLPIRPGKPVLGAIGARGQVILGLPGNPVSVLTAACRFAGPVVQCLSGADRNADARAVVTLQNPDGKEISMWWSRLVRLAGTGTAELLTNCGSGDMVAAARSDGFVEVPPGQSGAGPWPFFRWEI
ncbi:MAG: molybdopterin molybdotransferase MoeA [Tepidisphaeraceae bacterium]|jgi:molybdopterin molybdotransferase